MLRYSVRRHNNKPIFDACYVLNLDRRKDRWSHVQRQVDRAGLREFVQGGHIQRVSGVDGHQLDVAKLHQSGFISADGYKRFQLPVHEKLFGMDLTLGAIGCAMGHRKIWEMVVAAKNQCALILEDDVEFYHKFRRDLRQRWAHVPADSGIMYLGGLDLLKAGKPPRPFIAEGVRYAYNGHRELTAYVVTQKSAKRCLELTQELTWQVDTHICMGLKHDPQADDSYICDPLSYVFQPSLAIQVTVLGTDVQKQPAADAHLEDAARRLREFVGGETSVR